MNLLIPDTTDISELQRLETLLPAELHSLVVLTRSTKVNPALIATEKVGKKRFAIQIDLVHWQQLSTNHRDLLFWHEVSRIHNKTVSQFSREKVVMSTGLFFSLVEVISQNILSLSVALVATGLAGYQLYQRNRGERSLREATAADRNAIALAIQFGYSFSQACSSLHAALKILAKRTSQKSLWRKYQVRLRVLEIFAAKPNEPLRQTSLGLGVTTASRKVLNVASNPFTCDTELFDKLQ